ncbi:MAG TPA: hypothetical protein ENJ37_04370 [Deltaproteobacteria bacterium]|nr:hypothetical protein [Deltaproteobacteria bacterium]
MSRLCLFCLAPFLLLAVTACTETRTPPVETPEQVVERFYAYVAEGGGTTLGEAYRLVSSKHYKLDEEIFKNLVSRYPKNMGVRVVSSDVKDVTAVVTIEYDLESSFGGTFTTQTDVYLELDEEENAWKIDFTGESTDEGPEKYVGQKVGGAPAIPR